MIVGWVKGTSQYYPITKIGDEAPVCPCKGYHWRQNCKHIKLFNEGKYCSEMKYRLIVYDEFDMPHYTEGERRFNPDDFTIDDVVDNISKTEAFLSLILGMRTEIEQVV